MKLSLAAWSLNKQFRDPVKPLVLLDLPALTREKFGLDAIEPVSRFFASTDSAYLKQLVGNADRAGVTILNIAVDGGGDLSSDDQASREEGIKSYIQWIGVAKEMGVGAIRANSGGKQMTDRDRAVKNCTESFKRLCDEGKKQGVDIVIENHWGLSADPDAMVAILEAIRKTHGDVIGSLPDYGNWPKEVERYGALQKILPYAKAVHAKVLDIDENLNHPAFDLAKCVGLTKDAGYDGYLGIEYEGQADAMESVPRAIKKLSALIQ